MRPRIPARLRVVLRGGRERLWFGDMTDKYFTRLNLAERGWSGPAVDLLLDTVDHRVPVNHWLNQAGAPNWLRDRVLVAELSPDFDRLFRSWVALRQKYTSSSARKCIKVRSCRSLASAMLAVLAKC